MKILMLTNSYFPYLGGLEKSLHLFSQELRKLGHKVLIAAPGPAGRTDVREHVVRFPAFYHNDGKGIEFSVNLPLPGIFSKIMKKFRPDIIHTHYPFFMGDFALRLSRQYHLPLVFTYHIMFEHYVHYLPIQSDGIKQFLTSLAVGYGNMCHQVVAPTKSVRDILYKRGLMVPVAVIPTGVDVKAFAKGSGRAFRRKYGIPVQAKVVGHVSRLAPEKNLDFMVKALMDLLKQDKDVHVLIVGRGPSQESIQKKFKGAGFSLRVHMPGYLQGQKLMDAYHAMDVFAFASISETQGMVVAEALAGGVPVVALDAPGTRDFLQDRFNGRLVARQNTKDFSAALRWCLAGGPMRARELKANAKKSIGPYSIRRCTRQMLKIYRNLKKANIVSYPHSGPWTALEERVKSEWDIIKNLVHATEAGMSARKFQ